MKIESIAEVAHETNRAYCRTIGDNSQVPWRDAPEWQRTSAINGVQFHLDNPDANPAASHDNWLKEKCAEGWKYGKTKDTQTKEHPCCVPYDELPPKQIVKDSLFTGVVSVLIDLL